MTKVTLKKKNIEICPKPNRLMHSTKPYFHPIKKTQTAPSQIKNNENCPIIPTLKTMNSEL